MTYDQVVQSVRHDSVDIVFVDEKRHASITMVASTSREPLLPLPPLTEMLSSRDAHDLVT